MTGPSPAPLPSGPATASAVATRLGLGEDVDAVALEVAAVNDKCQKDWGVTVLDDGTFRPSHELGATLLAVRLYRRRDSPAGVATFGAEGAAYVQRNDPDVALLLGIGAYAGPRVG